MSKYPVFTPTETTTQQEVFDAVVEHLRTQGGPAIQARSGTRGSVCVNRTDDGKSCAAACMMSDEESGEGGSWTWRDQKEKPNRLLRFDDLLGDLQGAHDQSARALLAGLSVDVINQNLRKVANKHGLVLKTPLTAWSL